MVCDIRKMAYIPLNLKTSITDEGWRSILESEFEQQYFKDLERKLNDEYTTGLTIYPQKDRIFRAFNLAPFNEMRVVILGQEPYNKTAELELPGVPVRVPKADGLAFSVPYGITEIPRTLQNMYKELERDIEFLMPTHGCLEKWALEGVLLLNERLTVRASEPNSHGDIGWQTFTDSVIKAVSDNLCHVVFLLYGDEAKQKERLIDVDKHTVFKTDHPLDADNNFENSACFSRCNFALVMGGQHPINWSLRNETFDDEIK